MLAPPPPEPPEQPAVIVSDPPPPPPIAVREENVEFEPLAPLVPVPVPPRL
mgnify:CR=1 FL=1